MAWHGMVGGVRAGDRWHGMGVRSVGVLVLDSGARPQFGGCNSGGAPISRTGWPRHERLVCAEAVSVAGSDPLAQGLAPGCDSADAH
jgi:hypothetical protein